MSIVDFDTRERRIEAGQQRTERLTDLVVLSKFMTSVTSSHPSEPSYSEKPEEAKSSSAETGGKKDMACWKLKNVKNPMKGENTRRDALVNDVNGSVPTTCKVSKVVKSPH